MSDIKKIIGSRIKQLRKDNHLTQAELGNQLGVIKQTISSWETGISSPSNETLIAMSSLFHVSTGYLLGKETLIESYTKKPSLPHSSNNSLNYWIRKSGYGYDEVAQKLNISEDLLMDYIDSLVDIPYSTLISLANICNVSTDCLLGITENSRQRDFDDILPFQYNYEIAKRIKKLCQDSEIDINSSFLEHLLCLSSKEIFYLIEYGFVPHISTLIKLADYFEVSTDYLLCKIDKQDEKLLKTFHQLNEDNKDIIIGEMKKYLKEQYYKDSVAADVPLKQPEVKKTMGK